MRAALPALMIVLGTLAVLGSVYWLAAWQCVRVRLRRSAAEGDALEFAPPVSILKPLCGAEEGLLNNLRSFVHQDYPDYEIIFGVRDPRDPAIAAVRELQAGNPAARIRLVIAPELGMNPKTAIVAAMVEAARHEVMVLSDSDIRVERDYLRRVVQPLRDPAIGWVTCLYAVDPAGGGAAAVLDALHVNFSFLPSVAAASCLPQVRFALGATLAMRKSDLLRAGGLDPIRDHLADDYMIGALLARLGLGVKLADVVVRHEAESGSPTRLWRRDVRWARTIRTLGPAQYAGLLVTFSIFWSLLLAAASGGAAWALWMLLGVVFARHVSAWGLAGTIGLPRSRRWLVFLALSDLLDVAVWGAGLLGRRVTWRGRRYRLLNDGRLADAARVEPSMNLARRMVRGLDAFLRRRQRIFEYWNDPRCFFRIHLRGLDRPARLHDGTELEAGERIVELHLWSGHLPRIEQKGTDLAWAKASQRGLTASLEALARFLAERRDLEDIRAIHGTTVLVARDPRQLERLVSRIGFEFHGQTPGGGLWSRLHARGEDILIWLLTWTFNPLDRSRRVLFRRRNDLWMSRRSLIARYGERQQGARAMERRELQPGRAESSIRPWPAVEAEGQPQAARQMPGRG